MSAVHRFSVLTGSVSAAHRCWREFLRAGDTVVDATCGNGKDTEVLARCVFGLDGRSGDGEVRARLVACDVQAAALRNSQARLAASLPRWAYDQIEWWHGCHAHWPAAWRPGSVRLVAYNLGYLPGAPADDKAAHVTRAETTWPSIQRAMALLAPGGLLSIALYPGHAEGAVEQDYVLQRVQELDPAEWAVCHQRIVNRRKSPSLLLVEKANT